MRLKSFNLLVSLLTVFFSTSLLSDEKIDIWKNKEEITKESSKVNSEKVKKNLI